MSLVCEKAQNMFTEVKQCLIFAPLDDGSDETSESCVLSQLALLTNVGEGKNKR